MTTIGVGDTKNYPLEKFIRGVVAKLIRSYKISDFTVESWSGKVDSDFRRDMIQTGWLAALQCQQSHPEESKNPAYVRMAVVNSLLKFEQRDRPRRDYTDSLDDADGKDAAEKKAIPATDFSRHDLDLILDKARLTPTEQLVVELAYGLNNSEEHSVRGIAFLMDKPESWVQNRLNVARLKLQVAARV